MTEQAASKVLSQFDRSINSALEKSVAKKVQFTVKIFLFVYINITFGFSRLFQGKLSTYRFCDNVWTLVLKDFVVKDSNQGQNNTTTAPTQIPRAEKVKIVACDGKSKLFRMKSTDFSTSLLFLL